MYSKLHSQIRLTGNNPSSLPIRVTLYVLVIQSHTVFVPLCRLVFQAHTVVFQIVFVLLFFVMIGVSSAYMSALSMIAQRNPCKVPKSTVKNMYILFWM